MNIKLAIDQGQIQKIYSYVVKFYTLEECFYKPLSVNCI